MRAASYPLTGGMDIVSPQAQIPRGDVLLASNYVPTKYGFRRSGQYERFDGQTAPSTLPANDSTEQAALEAQRALILAVPGAGPVRGIAHLNGNIYAWRDNVGQTEARMYAATGAGWSEIAAFTASAYAPGGKYEAIVHNFGGHVGTKALYVATGVGKAFEWDGTTLTQITTGMTTDTPVHITEHISYLFLTFPGGSLQWSPTGDPTGTWTPVVGAGEIGLGEEITVIQSTIGGALLVGGETKTSLLQGRAPADFDLREHSRALGIEPYSTGEIGDLIFMSNIGITTLGATQNFGDFEHNSLSNRIQPYLDSATDVLGALVDTTENHYWLLYNSAGFTNYICGAFRDNAFQGFAVGTYDKTFYCTSTLKVAGVTRLFVGGEDGFVYELNKGTSGDGATITSVIKLPYLSPGTTLARHRFFRMLAEVTCAAPVSLGLAFELDYGDELSPGSIGQTITTGGGGGIWAISAYGDFSWSRAFQGRLKSKLTGTGSNISMTIAASHTYEPPHTLSNISYYYETRRLER